MDDKSRIKLDIPDPDEFEDEDWPHVYIPVANGVVTYGIDLLQCMLAQRRREYGCEPDDAIWDQLTIAGARMLAGLLSAWSDYYHGNQARKLVDQVAWFCHWHDARERLEALHGPPPNPEETTGLADADVVAALVSLHELSRRRLAEIRERKQRQEQPAPAATAQEQQLLAAFNDPRLFQSVVDSLPLGRERLMLKFWGVLHGAYPMSDETRRALDDEVAQATSAERTSSAVDSAEQAPPQDRDPGWEF